VAEGLVLVDEAVELAASGDTSSIPELSLLKGDLLTAAGAADADVAHWFQRSFDGAGDQGAMMTQLRAALRLCRLWRSQGTDDADRLLRSVYDTFTEGFATADLVEARTLLERLPPSSTR
jgi:predicted ATPase